MQETYPAKYLPGEGVGDHVEFALKYDGTNLLVLAKLFAAVPQQPVLEYVRSTPNGKYVRRVWYLYELLTGTRPPVEDVNQGNYVDVLDPEEFYTSSGRAVQRHRVRDNSLGDARFCPTIRRTERLKTFEQSDLSEKCRKLMAGYPVELLKRALAYLYTKESKSSFEIEHIKPSTTRTERFVALLQLIEETIEIELVQELKFLVNHDATKQAIQEVVDMPDRLIDLFIRSCLQNHGKLSNRKRQDCFPMRSDQEVAGMEEAIRREYEPG